MPRGNDDEGQKSALHELADEFGQGVGNAELMIARNVEMHDPDLAAVSMFPVDQEATDELDLNGLSGPEGDEFVLDAVVRKQGRTHGTVVVFEDESGRAQKYLTDSNIEERRKVIEEREGKRRSGQATEATQQGLPAATQVAASEGAAQETATQQQTAAKRSKS